jgi:hypothetical protein
LVRVERIARVVRLDVVAAHVVVDTPLVAQLPFAVEDEDVRRHLRPVLMRHLLRVAFIQIWEVELPVLRMDFHAVERIVHFGVVQLARRHGHRSIRGDGNELDALVRVIADDLLDAPFI